MKNIDIAYIGGGSRAWARNLMNDLALEKELCGTVRLYDTDHQAALVNEKIGNMYGKVPGAVSEWKYKAVGSLGEALQGADFVLISILPGTFDDMDSDVHLPEKFGIYQSVGDTVGPGGMMRTARAVPAYALFAQMIRQHCPEAFVINFSNPMTTLTGTLYKVFPGIKAFGCCHEVFGTRRLLAAMLREMGIAEDAAKNDIEVNVLGINHFTWIDRAYYKDNDLIPLYRNFSEKHFEKGYCIDGTWDSSFFSSGNRVKFDLFRRYGLIAAAGDRHLAEFCPGWYLKTPEEASKWQFSLTPVEWRKNDRIERMERSIRIMAGEEPVSLVDTGEDAVSLIKCLAGGGTTLSNVNMPNNGSHGGIPLGAVVETNAVFSNDGVTPVDSGRLPRDIEILVLRHVYNQEALVEACLE
ncbi:MAG: alpha-glucosidase/alpha-galactosidase, partial [Clostridia bacterium]